MPMGVVHVRHVRVGMPRSRITMCVHMQFAGRVVVLMFVLMALREKEVHTGAHKQRSRKPA